MLKNIIVFVLFIFHNFNYILSLEKNNVIIKTDNNPIIIGISERLPSLHPFDNDIEYPFIILSNLFEGLVCLSPEGEITSGLAKKYTYIKGDNIIYFHIDPKIKWSNGETIKADHFVNRFRELCRYLTSDELNCRYPMKFCSKKDRILNQLKILSSTYLPIKNLNYILNNKKDSEKLGITAETDYILKFELNKTKNFDLKKFLLLLSNPIFSPLMIDINDEIDYYRYNIRKYSIIPTAGPYKLTANDYNDSEILLIPNQYYNANNKINNKILFKYFDADNLKKALISDEIDIFYHTTNKMITDKKYNKFISCLRTDKKVKASIIYDDINKIIDSKKFYTYLKERSKKTYCDLSNLAREFKLRINKQNLLFDLHLNNEDDEFITNRIDARLGSRSSLYDHLIIENFHDRDLFIPLSYVRKAFHFKRTNIDKIIKHFIEQTYYNNFFSEKGNSDNDILGLYGSTELLHDAFVDFFNGTYNKNRAIQRKSVFEYEHTGNISPFIEYQEYASFNKDKIYFNTNKVKIFPKSLKFLTKKIVYCNTDYFRKKYDKCINICTTKHQAGLPFDSRNLEETFLTEQLFEGLFKYDYIEGKIVPAVAKSWWHSKDCKHWKFIIKDDAYWSDGSKIKAQNFIDSWKVLLGRGYVKMTNFPIYESVPDMKDSNDLFIKFFPIKNAEKIIKKTKSVDTFGAFASDEKTLEFYLDFPISENTMLLLLSQVELAPIYEGYKGEISPKVTNGRYKIDNIYQYGSSVVTELILNNYYKITHPNYNNPHKKIRIFYTNNNNSLFTLFNSGLVDIIYSIPEKILPEKNYLLMGQKIIKIPTKYYYTINVVDDLQRDSRLFNSLIKTLQPERNLKNQLIGKEKSYKLEESELEYKTANFNASVKEFLKFSEALGYSKDCPAQLRIDIMMDNRLNKITHFQTNDILVMNPNLVESYHGPDMISLNLNVIPINSFEHTLQLTYDMKKLVKDMNDDELQILVKNLEIASNNNVDRITRYKAKSIILKMMEVNNIQLSSIAFLQREIPIIYKKYLNITPNICLNNPRGLPPIEFWELNEKSE